MSHAIRYPLHALFADRVSSEVDPVRLCAATMILPEQVRISRTPGVYLYCLGCAKTVEVTPEERKQAATAARSEGWTPPLVR